NLLAIIFNLPHNISILKLLQGIVMKFKIEVDTEPEELRRFLGLPDVKAFQDDLLNKIREKMVAGAEGFDPVSLLKPYLPENLQSLQALQKVFWENFLGKNDPNGGKK
ncbi:DUF6489 family protein, partial [Staphylococcus aureus]|uniref:DUF6489 family protein n=1 Tax=Staphylococcus aureus TaxID=1280 RepID=UPI0039BE7D99